MGATTISQTTCDDCPPEAPMPAVNACQRCGKDLCRNCYTQTVGGGYNGVVLCVGCRSRTEPEFVVAIAQTKLDAALANQRAARGMAAVRTAKAAVAAAQAAVASATELAKTAAG